MNYPIKTEFNPDYCISCLKTDTQTLRDDQIEKDLVLILNDLLKNYVRNLFSNVFSLVHL